MNLAEALNSSDAVLFIGSGVSVWSGLPSWGGMLNELAEYLDRHGMNSELVRGEAAHGDLLQAASYGFDKLTRHQQGEFIRLACRYGSAQPSQLHRLLVSLGPRCFVTTNYDNLIEEALRLSRPGEFFRPPVTNRDLIGMPEIVQARAINFIFKPHGDAGDTESIVLTREQYRMLLPGGERQSALESLKMLLVSRPVIYVGFGLRDPDFLYLKDILLNIYKGGTRDHFALMADVSTDQIDYWRRSYGIHLINYETSRNSDDSRNHSELLTVLKGAAESLKREDTEKYSETPNPEKVLALARYASSLSQTRTVSPEFSIRVNKKRSLKSNLQVEDRSFFSAPVEKLLDHSEKTTILIGLPGAGKSYSLRKSVARQAERLHSACLQEKPDAADLVIPIFADLKLYQGSLEQLITTSLPATLDLHWLLKTFTVRIYLDSFNEVPRKFVESGEWEDNLQRFTQTIGASALIIGSRTMDGLENLGVDVYELDAIDESSVAEELAKLGTSLSGRFQHEMMALLQRPFFFRYVLDGEISLPDEPHPREFYRSLLWGVSQVLSAQLGMQINLEPILRPVAYRALNSGEEAFPVEILLRTIETTLGSLEPQVSATDVANALVSCSILVPYSGARIAFVHQSITEYLAAIELAERFTKTPELLREKLSLRRWDQALFLALSHLQPPLDRNFFDGVLNIDLRLAVTSAKFVESGREKLIDDLLSELIRRRESIDSYDFGLQHAIKVGFPIQKSHLPKLREIIHSAHPLRGAAATLVIEMCGSEVKSEFLKFFLDYAGDYNFCANSIGPSLASFASKEDLPTLKQWALELEQKYFQELKEGDFDEDNFHGFVKGVAEFTSKLPLDAVRQHFFPASRDALSLHPICAAVLRDIIQDCYTTYGLQCACDLLLLGDYQAAIPIYFILNFADGDAEVDTQLLDKSHVEALTEIVDRAGEEGGWAWKAINIICRHRPDLGTVVETLAGGMKPLDRAGLMMCARQDQEFAFEALDALFRTSDIELENSMQGHLDYWNLNWQGKEQLFLRLLSRKSEWLCDGLLGLGIPVELKGFDRVDVTEIEDWLEWMGARLRAGNSWLVMKLSSFLGKYSTQPLARRVAAEFNNPKSLHRSLLLAYVLPHFKTLTTDDLTNEASAFVIDELLQKGNPWKGEFLSGAATESFIVERLLPLLHGVSKVEFARVRLVLDKAGQRHGRRYF